MSPVPRDSGSVDLRSDLGIYLESFPRDLVVWSLGTRALYCSYLDLDIGVCVFIYVCVHTPLYMRRVALKGIQVTSNGGFLGEGNGVVT